MKKTNYNNKEKDKPTPLKDMKFDSTGEEYLFLYETASKQNLLNENLDYTPTLDELRIIYKEFSKEEQSYDDILKKKYVKTSIYWSDTQEQAVIRYIAEKDEDEKNRIFSQEIYKPLKKLIENIIFTYKLFRQDVDVNEIQTDCMSFLITKIERFDHTTGSKAFAYLGTISKHYLMGEKRVSYKMTKTNLDIDNHIEEASEQPQYVYTIEGEEEKKKEKDIFIEVIKEIEKELQKPKLNANDRIVGDAIVWFLKNHELLQIYNKNTIYHLLKEKTGLQTKEITNSISRFKVFYKVFKSNFIKEREK